jgi:surfeit locus 1 family protein
MAAQLRGLLLPGLLTVVALAILVSLGNWQVRRLAWKEDLVARATERPKGPVADLPAASEWPGLDVAEAEYRPYRLGGRFLHDKEALVFTSLSDPKGRYGGPGYWVVTPFSLEGGGTVLVNRGFAPQGRHLPSDRGETLSGSTQTVTGLLRPNETPNIFTPADKSETNIFYARNVAAIAAAKSLLPPVAPFTIDLVASETPSGGLPQAGETRMAFSNNHLQYAITWYGLAVALLGVFIGFAWTRLRGHPSSSVQPE